MFKKIITLGILAGTLSGTNQAIAANTCSPGVVTSTRYELEYEGPNGKGTYPAGTPVTILQLPPGLYFGARARVLIKGYVPVAHRDVSGAITSCGVQYTSDEVDLLMPGNTLHLPFLCDN
ncbi:MAG: hypothetical protein AABZ55_08935 [Bdellovibrionota bacterium]